MGRQEVWSKVCELVQKKFNPRCTLTETTSFVNDLNADSLNTVELVMDFEDAFGISSIPDVDGVRLTTMGKAVDYIVWRVNGKQGENPLGTAEALPGSGALGSSSMFKDGVGTL